MRILKIEMLPEAREVHLSRKDREVLEACCRSPVTLQRDLKRARIVLLAADGRSTRSIAKEFGVQPRIVSLWRHRYADHGLEGLQDKPRPGQQPIYTKATDKRILKLLDKPPPDGFARWTGPLLAEALGDVDVQYVWRFLRNHKIDLAARKSWCESTTGTSRPKPPMLSASTSPRPRRPLCYSWTRSPRSRPWSERRVSFTSLCTRRLQNKRDRNNTVSIPAKAKSFRILAGNVRRRRSELSPPFRVAGSAGRRTCSAERILNN